jgi:UDP-glucuronate decarboxylase
MRILVTGGAGFIGVNLCKRLVRGGHDVVCLDNFYSSLKSNVDGLNGDQFELVEHDIVEPFPESIMSGQFDRIYHLACPASPPRYQKDHIYTLRVNFEGTRNVLELARACGARVLFTSTSEVYGDPDVSPQNEEYRGNVNPHGLRSCYDEGKRAAESLCMNYWRRYDLPMRIVRIFNTYGPFMDKDDGRVVSNFIVQALRGENLTIYGDGKQTRSFQYIDDLVDGMIAYMNLGENFPGPVNLGNPDEITVGELAKKVISLTGAASQLNFSDLPQDDPMRRNPDISLAKEKFGWEPGVNLEDGLKKTIEYFRAIV